MTTCRGCGHEWTGRRMEHCTGCHETFSGTSAGDEHRIGDFAGPNKRRCLTPDEMTAKGMAKNAEGVWTSGGESPWALSQCDGSCHDRDEDCKKCELLASRGRIVGCDDCLSYAAQDAEPKP